MKRVIFGLRFNKTHGVCFLQRIPVSDFTVRLYQSSSLSPNLRYYSSKTQSDSVSNDLQSNEDISLIDKTYLTKPSGFYGRMLSEIRQFQGLKPIPKKRTTENYNELRKSYFAHKNYYDMRGLLIGFKIVLAHLADISLNRSSYPLKSVHSLPPVIHESATPIKKKYVATPIPPFPEIWDSPKTLEQYLVKLTSKKYTNALKKRPYIMTALILDLLRPNSPDTSHCRSTLAYNIAIGYFVTTSNLRIARYLLKQMITEGGSVYPNTQTFNIILLPTSLRLVGGASGRQRKYFNYFLRYSMHKNKKSITSSEISHEKKVHDEFQTIFTDDSINDDTSPFHNTNPENESQKNLHDSSTENKINLSENSDEMTQDIITIFEPKKSDSIYIQNPLEFAISQLKTMAKLGIPANAETWNIILGSAIGPAAKSVVLQQMVELSIPLSQSGQASVLSDIGDFMGPHKAIELILSDISTYLVTPETINVIVARLIDVPTSSNILASWDFVKMFSIKRDSPITSHNKINNVAQTSKDIDGISPHNRNKDDGPIQNDFIATTSTLNVFVKKFGRIGRLDWIIGIISGFKEHWNVNPDIDTWVYVLESVVRSAHHPDRNFLLSYIYFSMLEAMKTRTDSRLPSSARAWIRRARNQNEFHLKVLRDTTDFSSKNMNKDLESKFKDPFNVRNSEDISRGKELWEEAYRKLRWNDIPFLSFQDPESPQSSSTKNPSDNKINTEYSIQRFQSVGMYISSRVELDNARTTSPGDYDLYNLVKRLGIPQPFVWPLQFASRFKKSPNNTHWSLSKEWSEFYKNSKNTFRKCIDQEKTKQRIEMYKDPYGSYIRDLRKEFGFEPDN